MIEAELSNIVLNIKRIYGLLHILLNCIKIYLTLSTIDAETSDDNTLSILIVRNYSSTRASL